MPLTPSSRAMLNAKLLGIERRFTLASQVQNLTSIEYKRRNLLTRALDVLMHENASS